MTEASTKDFISTHPRRDKESTDGQTATDTSVSGETTCSMAKVSSCGTMIASTSETGTTI